MNTNFDPSKLGPSNNANASRKSSGPKMERLFLAVEHYETPADGYHFAVGERVDRPGEQVRVRLNTVPERQADRPNANVEAIKSQYVSGENTRDSIEDKAKAGIKLLSFDDAVKIGETNGVAEYRAHWPKTMSTEPNAEARVGLMQVRLADATEINGEHKKAVARVDQLVWSATANKDNADALLGAALAIKDDEGRARDPFVQLRVFHEDRLVQTARMYPESVVTKRFDQNIGDHVDIRQRVGADATLDKLLSGEKGYNEQDSQRKDVLRALVAGLKDLDEPTFHTQDEDARARVRNLFYGVKQGALEVEISAGEQIDFGPKARQTYLATKDRVPMKSYIERESFDPNDDTKVRETFVFAKTALAIHRHDDGEPYAVFASPTEVYPKTQKLQELARNPAGEPAFLAEVEKRKQAESEQQAEFSM